MGNPDRVVAALLLLLVVVVFVGVRSFMIVSSSPPGF